MTPALLRDVVDYVTSRRGEDAPFDFDFAVAGPGRPAAKARDTAADFAAAGATWYQVGLSSIDDARAALRLVEEGPPRA